MTSITSWIRLEPVCRNHALSPGLDARIHDGLWFLARQWQLGEFIGDDAGTPVAVRSAARPRRSTSAVRHSP